MEYLNSVLKKISNFISPLGLEFNNQYLNFILKKPDNDCTIQQLIKVVLENNKLKNTDYVIHVILIALILNKYKYNKSIHKDFSLEVFIQNIEKKYNSCFDFSHINDNLETESLDKIRKRFLNYDYIFNNSELDYLPCLLSHSIIESKINKILKNSLSTEYILISSDEVDIPIINSDVCIELDNYIFSYDHLTCNIIQKLQEENDKKVLICIVIHD